MWGQCVFFSFEPTAFLFPRRAQVTDDILKSCVKASGARRAFVVSDWKDRDELQVLSAALTADPAACPNLRVVKVRLHPNYDFFFRACI